jgi:hypothetical protein
MMGSADHLRLKKIEELVQSRVNSGNHIGGCLSSGAHEWLRNATDV